MRVESKTLYFTLCSRALDKSFSDPIAAQILDKNKEIIKFAPDPLTRKFIVNRAGYFDDCVKIMARKNTQNKSCLVNLGGGLCSRFFRVRNSIDYSIHLDLPEVIDLVENTMPQTADHLIKADLNSTSWHQEIKSVAPKEHLPIFTMEGVSMYLQKDSLDSLFESLPKLFPSGHIIVDLLHPFFSNKSYLVRSVKMVDASFSSGIASTAEILKCSSALQLVDSKTPYLPNFLNKKMSLNLYQIATFSWGH